MVEGYVSEGKTGSRGSRWQVRAPFAVLYRPCYILMVVRGRGVW